MTFALTPKDLPWHLNLAAYSGGVAMGSISHMRIAASPRRAARR